MAFRKSRYTPESFSFQRYLRNLENLQITYPKIALAFPTEKRLKKALLGTIKQWNDQIIENFDNSSIPDVLDDIPCPKEEPRSPSQSCTSETD